MPDPSHAPSAVPASVTVCVTSCGRLDLLTHTLESFRRFNPGGAYILSEDSAQPNVVEAIRAAFPEIRVLAGGARLGLMASIDRLYSEVRTPYIFHLEDDWLFEGPVDWDGAIALLARRDDIANVSLRVFEEIKPKYRARSTPLAEHNRSFQIMKPNAHAEFFGWSPNPGLIRTSLYRQYAPFTRMNPDQMSALIKREGRVMAYLLPGVARHIGQGRNAPDPTIPPRPKSRPAKMLRALKKRLYYAGLRKQPY
ncbi:MAG TPA: hypothetical protein VND97_09610 [Beijerinckiaceae bacterium]|nr:hypothetical protein [Beijerinckiaceae bacterium]